MRRRAFIALAGGLFMCPDPDDLLARADEVIE
jgi:hypothetical protein